MGRHRKIEKRKCEKFQLNSTNAREVFDKIEECLKSLDLTDSEVIPDHVEAYRAFDTEPKKLTRVKYDAKKGQTICMDVDIEDIDVDIERALRTDNEFSEDEISDDFFKLASDDTLMDSKIDRFLATMKPPQHESSDEVDCLNSQFERLLSSYARAAPAHDDDSNDFDAKIIPDLEAVLDDSRPAIRPAHKNQPIILESNDDDDDDEEAIELEMSARGGFCYKEENIKGVSGNGPRIIRLKAYDEKKRKSIRAKQPSALSSRKMSNHELERMKQRPKQETQEERRVRKQKIKEFRSENRRIKKETKLVFKEMNKK